jgi:hypothetical protein
MSTQYKLLIGQSGSTPTRVRVPKTGDETYLAPVTLDELGADSVINGGFTTDTGWVKDVWTIGSNVASIDGSQLADADLENTGNAPIATKMYEVVFTVSGYSGGGNVTPVVGNQEGTDNSGNGTYTEIITASNTDILKIRADVDFIGSIDNVTMKEITDEVAFEIRYTTNKAGSGGNDTGLLIAQTDTLSPGTSYGINYTVGGSSKFNVNNAGIVGFTGSDAAAAETATFTNGPTAGNPAEWMTITFNGSVRHIPVWA